MCITSDQITKLRRMRGTGGYVLYQTFLAGGDSERILSFLSPRNIPLSTDWPNVLSIFLSFEPSIMVVSFVMLHNCCCRNITIKYVTKVSYCPH